MYPFLEPHGPVSTVAGLVDGGMAMIGGGRVYPGWSMAGYPWLEHGWVPVMAS